MKSHLPLIADDRRRAHTGVEGDSACEVAVHEGRAFRRVEGALVGAALATNRACSCVSTTFSRESRSNVLAISRVVLPVSNCTLNFCGGVPTDNDLVKQLRERRNA